MTNRSRSSGRYQYTLYKQDGTIELLPISPKKTFAELYQVLGCTTIERIPDEYYAGKGIPHGIMFGDEEGRYRSQNHRNPHFNVLTDEAGGQWDVVGDCVFEHLLRKGDYANQD